jgi:hypothetical protein
MSVKDGVGTVMALLQRLEKRRIPTALALKDKVDRGETLSDYDKKFLSNVSADLRQTKPLLEQHPQYQELIDYMEKLYQEITDKALENAKDES